MATFCCVAQREVAEHDVPDSIASSDFDVQHLSRFTQLSLDIPRNADGQDMHCVPEQPEIRWFLEA